MRQDQRSIYLPTEILLIVAQYLWLWSTNGVTPDYHLRRQNSFYSFCLVSRQWYSVGIGFLYQWPSFPAGNSFTKFANTLCPSRGARKAKVDFGSLVKTLNMGGLVHHSTNSLTARLLGQTKKNLETFIAPRVSFAVNCLPALSKSQNLRDLNLSLVSGSSITFPRLKKAISNLPKLRKLKLPLSMSVTHTDSVDQWPPHLENMTIGGSLDPTVMRTFEWPPSIAYLRIRKCTDLSTEVLESLLQNEQLRVGLWGLDLDNSNEEMCIDDASDVLYTLPNLFHLSIPVDLAIDLLILPSPDGLSPLPIRELNLSNPCAEDPLGFDLGNEILHALSRNLSNVWSICLCEKWFSLIEEKAKLIDKALEKTILTCDDKDFELIEDSGLGPLLDCNLAVDELWG